MTDRQVIAREVDCLERLHAQIATIATRDDDRRRHDLVELRRRLAVQIGEVGRLSEAFVTASGDAALVQAFREQMSRMRSAAAMHQARWPAVMLGESDDEYHASARGVREASDRFVAWLREALARR